MTRILTTSAVAASLIACSPSGGDPETVDSSSAQTLAACPDNLVLSLEDYDVDDVMKAENFDLWHAMNAQRDGVVETESGLQYKVVQDGLADGMTPVNGEEVIAMYHGFRTDGEVFDSSYERDQPFIFPTDRVISGWTEAVEGMKVCEARTLYIPSEIAYGDRGAGDVIRPGETLIFNMQLLRVNRDLSESAEENL